MTRSRRFVGGALALVLVAAGLIDSVGRPAAVPAPTGERFTMPVAAPARASSSTWFCPGGTAEPAGRADARVVVVNTTPRRVTGVVTVAPSTGKPVTVPIALAGHGRAVVRLGDHVQAPVAAAVVEVDGGGVVVEGVVVGPDGAAAAPCSPSASERWYFADGTTSRDAKTALLLFNPFPEDALADLSFATEQGLAVPVALQGVFVPGGGVTAVDVGAQVRRRDGLATTVRARTGRLVVARITVLDGTNGRRGRTLVLGAPSPGPVWWFPDGLAAEGVRERIAVYNPGRREALVEVAVALDSGSAEPFELTVPPRSRVEVVTSDQARVPKGVAHASVVRSLNGVDVVAERTIVSTKPAARTGLASAMGGRRLARRWAFAAGGVTESAEEWITVYNPLSRPTRVSIVAVADGRSSPIVGLQRLPLGPGGRLALRLGDHIRRPDLPVVVVATRAVAAERGLYAVGAVGTTQSLGIPLP